MGGAFFLRFWGPLAENTKTKKKHSAWGGCGVSIGTGVTEGVIAKL